MSSRLMIALTHANAWIYAKSGGRIGGKFGGHRVLLLTTIGRKSGQLRRTPVQYEELEGRTIIAAAGGGSPRPPQWFLNVQARPEVTVQTGAVIWRARSEVLGAEEREQLWAELLKVNPTIARVREKAGREIPLVALDPE